MPEFDKTNTITINENDKGDNEKRPDFKADINIGGVRYFGSLWVKESAHGKFLSGPVEKADDKYQPNGNGAQKPTESASEASSDGDEGPGYF